MSVPGRDSDVDSIMPHRAADWCKGTDFTGLWVNLKTLVSQFLPGTSVSTEMHDSVI